jgi:NAD(P)H-hydrate epimerase
MRPVVDSKTMSLLEQQAFSTGQTVENLMDCVGKAIADKIQQIATPQTTIVLLAGKGHNAADGYTALQLLKNKGFSTVAWQLFPPNSSILTKKITQYTEDGGTVISYPEKPFIDATCLIIDGIYGTGFRGSPEKPALEAIAWANSTLCLRVSIDIPSGVDPTTGEVSHCAIHATHTLACHAPKQGCFFKNGWEYSGEVSTIPLGLGIPTSNLVLLEEDDIMPRFPRYTRTQNKYEAGSVVAIAGSQGMMGAASLSCEAAYTIGAGYVRILLEEFSSEICVLPREVVKSICTANNHAPWVEYLRKASTAFIGPGLSRTDTVQKRLEDLWPYLPSKTVVDADALFFLSNKPIEQWNVQDKILTPHTGEASHLIGYSCTTLDETRIRFLQELASHTSSYIVLKGAPTFLFSPKEPALIMPKGDPGMATAGTGDVLTGMIAGLLAQNCSHIDAMIVGTWIHGLAGEYAAESQTSYSVVASSLLAAIPSVMRRMLGRVTHANCLTY